MASVRNPRKIYVANISRDAKDTDLARLFEVCGKIVSLEYKGDYGFIEFQDVAQSDAAIRRFHGTDFMGKRIVVEPYVYRGGDFRYRPAAAPNPAKFRARNVSYRLYVTGLDNSTSWQDVKDFARSGGRSVCYTDVYTRHGKKEGVIEYSQREDYENALRILDGARLNGLKVNVYNERDYQKKRYRESSRSHSRVRNNLNEDSNNHRRQRSGSRRSRSNNRKSSRGRDHDRDNVKRNDHDNYNNKRSNSPNNNNNENSNNSRNDKDKYNNRYSKSRSPIPKRDSSNHNDRKINRTRSPRDEKKVSRSRSPKQSQQQQRNNNRSSSRNSRTSRNRDRENRMDNHDSHDRTISNERRRIHSSN